MFTHYVIIYEIALKRNKYCIYNSIYDAIYNTIYDAIYDAI